MVSSDKVKALIRSHADGDEERFYAIAMQVAAQAARNGHTKFAKELRDIVDQAKVRSQAATAGQGIKSVQLHGKLVGLLTVAYPKTRLADMALDDAIRSRIDHVLVEQRQRERILEHGLVPLKKLLLIGPSGTGKTMTAFALAGELGVPLFTIQTEYLGKSATGLRLIFDTLQQTRAVYLFDEIAARSVAVRGVLNSFLQFSEYTTPDSVVVATTNFPSVLYRYYPFFHHFDTVIRYDKPTREIAEKVLRMRLALLDSSKVEWSQVLGATEGLSHADLTRACEHVVKKAILAHRTCIETSELVEALRERYMLPG